MNLQTRIKHINKKLTKYSRVLFVLLSATGVILSFFISNVDQFKINKADTITGTAVAGLFTNDVTKLISLKDASDRFLTYTNQWGSPYIQINTHYDITDYNVFSICDTDLMPGNIISKEAVTADNAGNSYFIDTPNNQLEYYPYNDCELNEYSITTTSEATYALAYDNSTDNIFAAQSTKLIKFTSGNYDTTEEFSYLFGRTNPSSIVVNEADGLVYILFNDGIQIFDNSLETISAIGLAPSGMDCGQYIRMEGTKIYISDTCDEGVYQYDESFFNENFYPYGVEIRDFKVNSNFLFISTFNSITKFDKNNPGSPTNSNVLNDVDFRSFDLIGNNAMNLSAYYREVYQFELFVDAPPGCPAVTPAYVRNAARCERWIHQTSVLGGGGNSGYADSLGIMSDGTIVTLHGLGAYDNSGLYINEDAFYNFDDAELRFPVRMRVGPDNRIYVLFQQYDLQSGDPVIAVFQRGIGVVDFLEYTGLQDGFPRDFIFNSLGDIVSLNHADPSAGTSITVFFSGSYNIPQDFTLDFDFTSFAPIHIAVDVNRNIYMASGSNLRIIDYDSATYSSSTLINLTGYNISNPQDIFVKSNPGGGEDIYISGSNSAVISKVLKLVNVDLAGNIASTQEFLSTYGRYSSYSFGQITVDPYNNLFAIPAQGSNQIAHFTPDGTLHDFDLTDSSGATTDVLLDSSNNLFVSSQGIEYQQFNYDYTPYVGSGDVCPTVTPPYVFNNTRCERYLYNSGLSNTTTVDIGEEFIETAMDDDLFFAATTANRIYAVDNYWSIPAQYNGIYGLKADPTTTEGVYFYTTDGSATFIVHFDRLTNTYDFAYDTTSSQLNVDYDIASNGDLYVLGHSFGNTTLYHLPEDDYSAASIDVINLDFTFPGSCTPKIAINDTDDIIAGCGLNIRSMNSTNYEVSNNLNMTGDGLSSSGFLDMVIEETPDSEVNLYVTGQDDVSSHGIVLKYEKFSADFASYDSVTAYNADSIFASIPIEDLVVENNGSIFASSSSLNTQMVRFIQDGLGTFEIITPIIDQGPIRDIVVDSSYNLYLTSAFQAYQYYSFDFEPPSFLGTNACIVGGDISPSTFVEGSSVNASGYVEGDPPPFPLVYPTGFIEIRANGLPVTSAPLDGIANINYDFLINTPGTYTISYFYPGDDEYAACGGNIESVTVNIQNVGTVESVVDVVSLNPTDGRQMAGENMFLTFHVRDPNDNLAIVAGDVELVNNFNQVIGTQTLDGSGNVVFNTKNIRAGGYGVFARYLGNNTYSTSNSYTFGISIFSIGTRVTLVSSENPVTKGDSFTLTATLEFQNFVPSVGSPVLKNGWIFFRDATNTFIDSILIDLNGVATTTINTSDLPVGFQNLDAGIHHIRAYYVPDYEERNVYLRRSNSETLFQSVVETGSGGGSDIGSDIPPSGGEGGNSDFSAIITGRDKATGSLTQTKIGSLLSWIMSYNNLGPNSNSAITYFPIRENQDFVVGSVVAPVSWTITYSQDSSCDDSTFNYIPPGADGTIDTLVRCIKFQNDRLNVPPTRSDVRYITTSANFSELNVGALGGTDVYKVVADEENNKLYYFNHHFGASRRDWAGGKSLFCFDLEINDTCVSENPDAVYPVWMGLDGWNDEDDELFSSQTSFSVNAEIVAEKMYIPMTNVNFNDNLGGGHGLLCWDLATDFYCSGPSFKSGVVILNNTALNSWGWGNIGDVDYNPDLQEIYTSAVGPTNGYMELLCYSTALNTPCPGQPYSWGTIQGYDIGWGVNIYQPSTDRIYASIGGGINGPLERKIACMIATTKTLCPDFPAVGTTVVPNRTDQSVFINPTNDQMCVIIYSDGLNSPELPPFMYCYDPNTESFYDYMPSMADILQTEWSNIDFNGPYPDDKFYIKTRWNGGWGVFCFDMVTKQQCIGWEGGKATAPLDSQIYTMRSAFGCVWGASDSGRVFTFDEDTGGICNPLITLTQGNVAVKLDGNDMFCGTTPDDISWNKVKVLDSGSSPSPALLNTTVYDSTNCTTDNDNIVSCSGAPLKSGNLLLNSGHELDVSDIDYNLHKSLTAILEFAYPEVPSPAPGFYIELNPTNKAQMCAETKLLFSGALCANPITSVCENTNINYINDPVSNNNGGQYCLNVETYFGKDPNSALCFVAATPEQRIFTVFNPNATLAPNGTPIPFDPEDTYNRGPGNYSFGNGFFGFFQNIIETTIPQIINEENVRNIVSSINTQTPLAITAVTAVTTATVVVTSVFAAGSGLGQVFGVLLGFFTTKRKKYWGIIFDDLTNKPVAFASITLSSKEIGKDNLMKSSVITQAVSDLDGQYRLNTDRRDKFYLEVKASGYQPYTKFISMVNPLNSAEDIVYDIPLRRLDVKSNFFKTLLSYRKKGLINFARSILLISSIFGFVFTIYTQINFPNNINLILISVYVIIFMLSFYPSIYSRIQKRGKVIDVDFNSPIPGAVVRIYDTKQQIALALTNVKGEARFDVPAGEYSILASKRGYIMVAEQGRQLVKAILKKEGYLDKNILLKRIEEAPMQQSTGLDNPFA